MAPKRKAATANSSSAVTDFSKLTVAELKKQCATRSLDDGGKKADLVKRLKGYETGGPPPAKLQKQSTVQRTLQSMKDAASSDSKKARTNIKPDKLCTLSNCEVYKDYDCMLNQTNIGFNNNKYYIIQVLQQGNRFYAWNRWGRVGEPGQNALKGPFATAAKTVADFEKRFREKTRNDWNKRAKFTPSPGKYTLLEMGGDDESPPAKTVCSHFASSLKKFLHRCAAAVKRTKASTLDAQTQSLIKLIFDHNMFKDALLEMQIDVKKMPLGKLSKAQIVKGFECLDEIDALLKKGVKDQSKYMELSSKFYTVIPHDFGRERPPVINSDDALRKKLDVLITLGDIEMAQTMLEQKEEASKQQQESDEHPLDTNYKMLGCKLTLLEPSGQEYKVIEKYLKQTKGGNVKQLRNVLRMERDGEAARFKAHDHLAHRKLLWHGTKVAVVAAILKSGLRIMPHSGGRVGAGIYFASENSKSARYVGSAQKRAIMFLNEVALGNEKYITLDNSRLRQPPPGFDSVVARGQTEPDPKADTVLMLDGKKVIVPQGSPIHFSEYSSSRFSQSEYLVYSESQVRMRYLLEFDWMW